MTILLNHTEIDTQLFKKDMLDKCKLKMPKGVLGKLEAKPKN